MAPETSVNNETVRVIDQAQIEIESPHRPLVGQVAPPGSKSITNRALLIAALASGSSHLSGILISDDTLYMMTALRAMGVEINNLDSTTLSVRSPGKLKAPQAPLFLGNSGTTTRFLTAAAALADGEVILDGDKHMRQRPIRPLVDALHALGVDATTASGCPPVIVKGRGSFSGDRVEVDANLSSQYVSALLMIAACGEGPVEVALRGARTNHTDTGVDNPEKSEIGARGYIDLTLATMRSFGASITAVDSDTWRVEPTGYSATEYKVEPDASACTYFWAAEVLTGGRIEFQSDTAHMTQPDAKARDLIRQFPNLPSVIDGSQIQDAIPTLAVLAAFNMQPVRFVGIGNLRVKECDRIRALSIGLCQIKPGLATEEGDELVVQGNVIQGNASLAATEVQTVIDSWDDHRIAMSFALAGLRLNGIIIDNPGCVSKTFPGYWDALANLGVNFKVPEARPQLV
jgi:3-phosphoshikimate 1-carboxyvinyltransferase